MAVTTLPDGRIICYWTDPISKRRKKKYFGRGPAAEASANQYHQSLGLKRGRPPRKRYGPTFGELAEQYYYNKGFDRKPSETLSYRLDGAINPAIGHLHAVTLTIDHLEKYVAQRRRDGVKDNSIRRELTDIKAILNWAAGRKPPLIPLNPVRDFQGPPDRDEIILPPDPDELAAIFKHACPHLQRFITLASFLGCRPGATELLSLTWASVNFPGRSIRVISADKGGPPSRQVPVHDMLYPELERWHQADVDRYESEKAKKRRVVKKMHIVHYWGERITTIKRAWRAALDGAKITRRIRPYDLRHRFVTLALENGADIGALADIVGSRPETLRKYYQHVTREMHRRTIQAIPVGTEIVPKNPQ